jgi:hypothetical protein
MPPHEKNRGIYLYNTIFFPNIKPPAPRVGPRGDGGGPGTGQYWPPKKEEAKIARGVLPGKHPPGAKIQKKIMKKFAFGPAFIMIIVPWI